jgi:hypothetical protein
MSKTAPISVLTANRLGDGIVVFLDFEGAWNENLAEAVVARSPDEVKALEDRGAYDATHNIVVEPYLVEVREAAGGLTPIRHRERVRAAGPSILDDVPGYSPALPSSRFSHHAGSVSSTRREGQGEGQKLAPAFAAAPHPDPLPAGGERETLTQAA